uniref:Uncharacterized protein n=1 Tax=Wuchereria bancrofti TaxID=6293 RepID=A0A1I8EYV5_WUCBA
MLETKENYLRALKIVVQHKKFTWLIIRIQVSSVQLLNLNSGLLTKAEISQVFAKIPPPIDVHENICCTHQSYIMHWMNERLIGKLTLKLYKTIPIAKKCFVISLTYLYQITAESRVECQRNNLPDLLVRPI